MSAEYQSVAVVDTCGDHVVVWHVDVSSDASLIRKSGAWVFRHDEQDKLELLTRARYLAATTEGRKACEKADASGHSGLIDLAQTLLGVAAEISRLQAAFENAAAKAKSALVSPRWPVLPLNFNLSDPPRDANAAPDVAVALGIARWVESLAVAWELLEEQRLMRKYLSSKDVEQRVFPVVLAI